MSANKFAAITIADASALWASASADDRALITSALQARADRNPDTAKAKRALAFIAQCKGAKAPTAEAVFTATKPAKPEPAAKPAKPAQEPKAAPAERLTLKSLAARMDAQDARIGKLAEAMALIAQSQQRTEKAIADLAAAKKPARKAA